MENSFDKQFALDIEREKSGNQNALPLDEDGNIPASEDEAEKGKLGMASVRIICGRRKLQY